MLTSLAFIFLAGLAMAAVCERIGLPRIIGMLFTGIVLGPVCAESAGSVDSGHFVGASPDGADYYFVKSWSVLKPCGFKESRTPCYDDGICPGEL